MAETVQICTDCLQSKPIDDFKSKSCKTGNRVRKTCSACRDRKQSNRAKRKSNDADISEPPVEDTHVPHFMRPTTASSLRRTASTLRKIAPQRVSAQVFQQQTLEQSQQVTSSSPAPSFHLRGTHSQDTPQIADARRRREQDRRAHRVARRAGEDVPPTQELDIFADYAKHLMKFHDGRFARHPRFRYVVFNTMMRQQANTKASFFIKQKTKDGHQITADDLRLAFEDDAPEGEALLNSITRRSGTLRGTRPFWTNKHQHLKAMVKNIGPSHLFLTLSAADLQWADLMQHLPNFEQWKAGTSSERIQIARDNLRDNPHIVAQWFLIRYNTFRKEYASNVEKKTESYKDMMKGFLPKLNPQNPLLSAVSKMMNRLIGERDWSAQEVLHLLLDIPLQSASRICINVDCRPEEVHSAVFVPIEPEIEGDETVQRGLSALDKYKRRHTLFEDLYPPEH
ncbi:hypothetical protein TSTA_041440 [Talaromyces stipitatus ATCC 10500]|uniref:Helitron helicase-like domain-containing protein n=1 Tax=Talaromyces stipitatus (strain ATCC 10500 / CBS 375.48 / QM 6759 / NRRL 1006) TaxID=441959 RepID=B8MJ77_TALSN|nr:uncharacterized protein TSTA_041440 [Talaromyces stipitatus ATCC 10500]EED14666.1 hypothetical protein TSTA_041440 [Talaromyces stipitatus ATCC 10500]